MSNNEPIRQHYLPQMYLRNFINSNKKIWVYNDKEESTKELSTKDTTLIKHFYTFEDEKGNKDYKLEKWFSEIETKTKPILNKIIHEQTITMNEKEQLALFIAVLQNRTPLALDLQDSFTKPTMEWMKNMHLFYGDFDELIKECPMGEEKGKEYIKAMDMSLTKQAQWHLQVDQAATLAQYYTNMEWTIFYTDIGSFLTTDNPLITLSTSGNYGIATPGNTKMITLAANVVLLISDLGNHQVHAKIINDKKQICVINKLLYLHRRQFVIADNKGLLENMQKRCKNNKMQIAFKNVTANQ